MFDFLRKMGRSEHELVEILGVSRVVVREAIRNLEKAGLLEIKRGPAGGAFVRPMKAFASGFSCHTVVKDRKVLHFIPYMYG